MWLMNLDFAGGGVADNGDDEWDSIDFHTASGTLRRIRLVLGMRKNRRRR